MKIKGILFDKDGTLIDFFSLWLGAAERAIPKFLENNNINDEKMVNVVLESIGVKNSKVDPRGALAYKSYSEIGNDIYKELCKHGYKLNAEKIGADISRLFDNEVNKDDVNIVELYDLHKLFEYLKGKNIYIGLATTDTLLSAEYCLKRLNVNKYFDFIGADDGVYKPKPAIDLIEAFCSKFNLKYSEIAVVGDTYNDMIFAKNSGALSIGVLSGVSTIEDFKGHADIILKNVGELVINKEIVLYHR